MRRRSTMTTDDKRAAAIAALNDALRRDPFSGEHGRVMQTAGVVAEGVAFVSKALTKLANLTASDFEPGNDPYGERDFAVIEVDGVRLYAKVDYYAKGSNLTLGSETPDDPASTERVMTIMLSSEY